MNFLIVNVGPFVVMSFVYVAFTLLPSGRLASRIGAAYDMYFPHLWASFSTKLSSLSESLKRRLVFRFLNIL